MKYQLDPIWNQIRSIFSFHWESPLFLYGLILPFLFFTFKYWIQKNKRAKIVLHVYREFPQNKITFLQSYIPDILQAAFLMALFIALAGPYKTFRHSQTTKEGINIAIGIDVSSSMANKDVAPSRLDVAKKVALQFIQKRITFDAFSIVAFAGEPNLVSPLTKDLSYLMPALESLKSNIIKVEGTALGDAMGTCINQLREDENPKKLAIIISDGNNTAGNLDPEISSKLARIFKIKFYTIAVGLDGNLIDPVDEATLRSIAQNTSGKFFRANNSKTLADIFSEIDQLEKTKLKINKWEEHVDQSKPFVVLALLLFLINLGLKLTWIGNIFED